MLQHCRAQVIDHDLLRHAERVEGVDVRRQKLLHGLRAGEFDIHQPTPGQHHDEEGQATTRIADRDGAVFSPVDLCDFPRSERECEEILAHGRSNLVDILLDDADAASVTGLLQTLEDLLSGQGMRVEPADDATLERIELARPHHGGTGFIGAADPVAHGLDVQAQGHGELGRGEVFRNAIADGAPG